MSLLGGIVPETKYHYQVSYSLREEHAVAHARSAKLSSYLLAFLLLIAAIPISRALDAPSSCFIIVVMASCLSGGRGPAVFATLLSTVAFQLFFVPAAIQAIHEPATLLRFGILVGAMLLTIEIIEARKRSERARLRIHEEFRSLAETSPDCILSVDSYGLIRFANPALTNMFGFAVGEIVDRDISSLIPGLALKYQDGGEFSVLRKTGQTFEVEATCGSFGDRTTIFLRDISERKRTQRKLVESEENLRLTLETIPGLVYTRAPNGTIEYANGGLAVYLGNPTRTASLEALLESIHPDDSSAILKQVERSFAAGLAYTLEYRSRRHDGIYRWLQASAKPLRNSAGELIRWYELLTDVDDLRRTEDSLLRTQAQLAKASQIAAIAELSASLAHEISQPMAAIVANGQACVRWLEASPPRWLEAHSAAERIVRDGKDAGQVIQGLRSLYHHSSPTMIALRLEQVASEVSLLLRGRAERDGIALEVQLPSHLPQVLGDKLQVQQVLVNLAMNGMDAMQMETGRPKCLIIRVRQEDKIVLTEIVDTGVGVADFTTIFDSFSTTKEHGLGMGLSICRSIVDAHGGRLWGSANTAGGAVFSFTMPIDDGGALES